MDLQKLKLAHEAQAGVLVTGGPQPPAAPGREITVQQHRGPLSRRL